ncbi:MAG: M14 family metallopeptidase [Calditrichia bacterium]
MNIHNAFFRSFIFIMMWIMISPGQQSKALQSPKEYFGFRPGEDRKLINYEQLIAYLSYLDQQSEEIYLEQVGTSPLGKPIYIAFISHKENIQRLPELKQINEELALDYTLSDEKRAEYQNKGRVFVLGTLSMHSTEVGPSQAAPEIAYELITSEDKEMSNWLDKVVYMMVPCHNPDGMDMVVDHYLKSVGTTYEGSSLPRVYHKYVGHDNNRDFVTLTQEDTRAIATIYNTTWYPQVMVEKHQMMMWGPRYFVPPPHDPIAENIDAGIWNWIGIFGSNLMRDMTNAGLKGVSQHYLFDDYWPGSTETCIWKNVIGFLTECASARYATPVYVDPTELKVFGKGLSEYKKGINMPDPWPGGWWRLSDIVEYEKISTWSILKTSATHAEQILIFRNDMAKNEVKKGLTRPPYFYHIPLNQTDQSETLALINLMMEHGVNVFRVEESQHADGYFMQKGDFVIPLSQPYRAFIKEVMESQKFPVRNYTPDGPIIKPYDITSWSLPLHKGVLANEINKPVKIKSYNRITEKVTLMTKSQPAGQFLVFSAGNNESFKVAFYLMKQGIEVYRTTNSFSVDKTTIPTGSFVVENKPELPDLTGIFTVPPIELESVPDNIVKPVGMPRIGLVETYFHDMDAGWTRYIFDSYYIPYRVIHPDQIEKNDLEKNFDILIFPDNDKTVLMEGKWKSDNGYGIPNYEPKYIKGIGKKGFQKILKFLQDGGKIIAWGRSTELFIGNLTLEKSKNEKIEFKLPVNNVAKEMNEKGLYIPGSLVRITLRDQHPLTFGLNKEVGVFYRGRPVFQSSIPVFDMDREVIGVFPEESVLMSGYAEKEKLLGNKVAAIYVKKGKGSVFMMAFNPQFRAQMTGTFKLVFNALWY